MRDWSQVGAQRLKVRGYRAALTKVVSCRLFLRISFNRNFLYVGPVMVEQYFISSLISDNSGNDDAHLRKN